MKKKEYSKKKKEKRGFSEIPEDKSRREIEREEGLNRI